jgi:hypothetical protein
MRIVPTVQLIEYYQNASLINIFFGKGAGQSVEHYSALHGTIVNLGFTPAFAFNYGLVGYFLFVSFFLSLFPRKKIILVILFTLFTLNADFNTQIFLYVLFTALLAKQIENLSN